MKPLIRCAVALAGIELIPYSAYSLVYALKLVLTMLMMAFVWTGYRRFAWRVSPLSFLVARWTSAKEEVGRPSRCEKTSIQ